MPVRSLLTDTMVTRDVSLGPDEQYFVLETTFTDMGLRSDTGYKYRVRAIGAGGTEGPEVGIEESTLRPPTLTPSQTPGTDLNVDTVNIDTAADSHAAAHPDGYASAD